MQSLNLCYFADNGGGMDPDKMRQCMSLGYSAKSKIANTIGQYGNGFKTSTMRLGADVIVFSRSHGKDGRRSACFHKSAPTISICSNIDVHVYCLDICVEQLHTHFCSTYIWDNLCGFLFVRKPRFSVSYCTDIPSSARYASPRLLLPMSDGLGSLRESSVGSLGSPFSSPSPSVDIARQLVATVEIDRYWPILGDNEVKQPQSVVTPGSGWSVYRFVGGLVHIPLYGRFLLQLDYEKEKVWSKMLRSSSTDWNTNLETIIQWSPYSSESDLLQQEEKGRNKKKKKKKKKKRRKKKRGRRKSTSRRPRPQVARELSPPSPAGRPRAVAALAHGRFFFCTRRRNVSPCGEKDEVTSVKDQGTRIDIQVRGVNRDEKKIEMAKKFPNSRHFLTYRHSLRVLPTIISCFLLVHVVTIGFVKDAKDHIDVQGFNVYHKNRLIKVLLVLLSHSFIFYTCSLVPFWRVWSAAGSDGRGVIGTSVAYSSSLFFGCYPEPNVFLQVSNNCHRIGYAPRFNKKNIEQDDNGKASASAIVLGKSGNQKSGISASSMDCGVKSSTKFGMNIRAQSRSSGTHAVDDDSDSETECTASDKRTHDSNIPKAFFTSRTSDKIIASPTLSPSPYSACNGAQGDRTTNGVAEIERVTTRNDDLSALVKESEQESEPKLLRCTDKSSVRYVSRRIDVPCLLLICILIKYCCTSICLQASKIISGENGPSAEDSANIKQLKDENEELKKRCKYLASAVLARLSSPPAGRLRAVVARGSPTRHRRPRVAYAPSSPAGRLPAVVARGHDRSRFFSRTRRRSVSPREETDRSDLKCLILSFIFSRVFFSILHQLEAAQKSLEEANKEQEALIDIFSEERSRRDREEENLRKKLKDASRTIQELLEKLAKGQTDLKS
ncbi:hypothetical protein GW17_00010738 [Ensete ventricosum]|nr:hypothetical protein GW17_00010738 [Ensete ventricosum]RZR82583.1 hypothetical protein BHM03_00009034 [Ensete ventricosum]